MSLPRALPAVSGLAAVALLALTPSVALSRAADGTISTALTVNAPTDVAYSAQGTLLVADPDNHVVRFRQSDGDTGIAAGTGDNAGGCPNTSGNDDLGAPRGVEFSNGQFFIIDRTTNCVRFVGQGGGFERVAGNSDGQPGSGGDNGPADSARLREPSDIALAPDGSIYIADTGNHRIRRVSPQGVMLPFAGTGTQGSDGDGGPARSAQLSSPRDIAIQPDGGLLVADTGNHRIRRVAPDGTITTVAGGNGVGPNGDGDPARTAQLSAPAGLLSLPHGGFLVADTANNRVRRITPLGAIFTVAGTTAGNQGDGGQAKQAQLTSPTGLAARPAGGFTVADTGNSRVREVTDVGAVPGAATGRSINVEPVSGDVRVAPVGGTGALPLQEEDLVPLGSGVDARKGQLTVTVRRDAGQLQPALVYDGSFEPSQRAGDTTDLTLTDPLVCPVTASIAKHATATKKKKRKKGKTQRKLWVKGKGGKYNTKGRYVGALERGTEWLTEESCTSATVTVRKGSVRVRNRVTGKSKLVRAGESYTLFV